MPVSPHTLWAPAAGQAIVRRMYGRRYKLTVRPSTWSRSIVHWRWSVQDVRDDTGQRITCTRAYAGVNDAKCAATRACQRMEAARARSDAPA